MKNGSDYMSPCMKIEEWNKKIDEELQVAIDEKYKHIKDIKDLENVPLVLPVPGSNNRRFLDEILIKKDVKIKRAINIHTSEGIMTAVKNDLGVGYIIEDIIKGDDTYKCINIKTKLHHEEVALIYNRKFLTKVPLRFIEEQLNIKIK